MNSKISKTPKTIENLENISIVGNPNRIRKSNIDFELADKLNEYYSNPENFKKKEEQEENKVVIPNEKNIINPPQDLDGYIYVPSINQYFTKERLCLGKNWFDTHKSLQSNNQRMPTIPEFIEFLKYSKINFPDIYKDITEVREPWRANWLDADFKLKGEDLYINYNHILDSNGKLVPKNIEIIDKNTLMEDKIPGISLDDYINKNYTKQGLPNKEVKSGDFYYWFPRSNNNSVAGFLAIFGGAGLICGGDPSDVSSSLGVFGIAQVFDPKLAGGLK